MAIAVLSLEQLEQALVMRAEAELDKMLADAAGGNPDAVERKAKRVADIANDKNFPMARRRELQDRCKLLLRQALEKSVNLYLDDSIGAARSNDDTRRNMLIAKAKEHYGLALRAGAGEEFKLAVRRKLETIGLAGAASNDEKAKRAEPSATPS